VPNATWIPRTTTRVAGWGSHCTCAWHDLCVSPAEVRAQRPCRLGKKKLPPPKKNSSKPRGSAMHGLHTHTHPHTHTPTHTYTHIHTHTPHPTYTHPHTHNHTHTHTPTPTPHTHTHTHTHTPTCCCDFEVQHIVQEGRKAGEQHVKAEVAAGVGDDDAPDRGRGQDGTPRGLGIRVALLTFRMCVDEGL
jgi:hypothetical protein